MMSHGVKKVLTESRDYDLALKFFLRAIEMETDPGNLQLGKTNTRSWWGVKLVSVTSFPLVDPRPDTYRRRDVYWIAKHRRSSNRLSLKLKRAVLSSSRLWTLWLRNGSWLLAVQDWMSSERSYLEGQKTSDNTSQDLKAFMTKRKFVLYYNHAYMI